MKDGCKDASSSPASDTVGKLVIVCLGTYIQLIECYSKARDTQCSTTHVCIYYSLVPRPPLVFVLQFAFSVLFSKNKNGGGLGTRLHILYSVPYEQYSELHFELTHIFVFPANHL